MTPCFSSIISGDCYYAFAIIFCRYRCLVWKILFQRLIDRSGLKINANKTKVMVISRTLLLSYVSNTITFDLEEINILRFK